MRKEIANLQMDMLRMGRGLKVSCPVLERANIRTRSGHQSLPWWRNYELVVRRSQNRLQSLNVCGGGSKLGCSLYSACI